MEIVYIILNLLLTAVVSAVCFYLLVYPGVTLKDAFKLVSAAVAINKFFLTGSGCVSASYLSRSKDLPFYKALSAFLLLEALGVPVWLGLGIYFGAKLTVRIPGVFVPILAIMAVLAWWKREKFIKAAKNILAAFKDMGRNIPLVIPFIVLNMGLFFSYYFFLFRLFDFYPRPLEIIKIMSVSFTTGYLSPAPAGLGFRDTSLVLLLVNSGVAINKAILIAIFDRVFVTVFWAVLGGVFSYSLIKEEVKRRLKRNT